MKEAESLHCGQKNARKAGGQMNEVKNEMEEVPETFRKASVNGSRVCRTAMNSRSPYLALEHMLYIHRSRGSETEANT